MLNTTNFLNSLLLLRMYVRLKSEAENLTTTLLVVQQGQQDIFIEQDLVNSIRILVAFVAHKRYGKHNRWVALVASPKLNKKWVKLRSRKRRRKKEKFNKIFNKPHINYWFDLYTGHFKKKSNNLDYNFTEYSLPQSWLLGKYVAELTNSYIGVYPTWIFYNLKKVSKNEKFYLISRAVNRKRILGPFYHDNKALFKSWFTKLTYLKDPSGLANLARIVLLRTHLKKHRIMFFMLNRVLKVWFYYFNEKQGILGYSLFFKGKLGKKGSVKKTKFFRKYGITSFTNKKVRVNHKEYFVITITGVVGAGLSIFF